MNSLTWKFQFIFLKESKYIKFNTLSIYRLGKYRVEAKCFFLTVFFLKAARTSEICIFIYKRLHKEAITHVSFQKISNLDYRLEYWNFSTVFRVGNEHVSVRLQSTDFWFLSRIIPQLGNRIIQSIIIQHLTIHPLKILRLDYPDINKYHPILSSVIIRMLSINQINFSQLQIN